jgi:hypothetical protein
MRPAAHIVQGTVSAAALYPFFGGKAVLFGLSVILIDLDHVIEYVWDTGDWSLRGFFVYHEVLFRNLQADFLSLNIFHTVEFYLLGAWLGQWFPFLYPVVAGCLFHHLFDFIGLVHLGHPGCKAYSFVDYFVRRKGHALTIRDVLNHPAADVRGTAGIEEWKVRWGVGADGAR